MTKKARLTRTLWVILPVLLILSGRAAAAQFSARMLIKDADKVVPGRIYVQDGKMRQEFSDAEGQTVTIVRPDLKLVWILFPWKRAYAEMPLKLKLPGQFLQMPPDALGKRLVGKETVNGFETERYEINVRGGRGLEQQTFWLAPKLATPIKMVCTERRFSMEYQDIKEGPQPDRLFNLPPGYQKLDTAGFGDRAD